MTVVVAVMVERDADGKETRVQVVTSAAMHVTQDWYVAVDGQTVGPMSTDSLLAALGNGEVSLSARICPVGGSEWIDIAAVPPFDERLGSQGRARWEETRPLLPPMSCGLSNDAPESLPAFPPEKDPWQTGVSLLSPTASSSRDSLRGQASPTLGFEGPTPASSQDSVLVAPRSSAPLEGMPVDLHQEESAPPEPVGVDWQQPLESFGRVNGSVQLPDQERLAASLELAPEVVLIQKDVMWNLALCLAFGSDFLAEAAGRAFFRAFSQHPHTDRLVWMPRVLLARGFLPSGIPPEAGRRGLSVLQTCCPPQLLGEFAKVIRASSA
ncbi:DUF4339 domain-containing protein [Myxococcota bacterium]